MDITRSANSCSADSSLRITYLEDDLTAQIDALAVKLGGSAKDLFYGADPAALP